MYTRAHTHAHMRARKSFRKNGHYRSLLVTGRNSAVGSMAKRPGWQQLKPRLVRAGILTEHGHRDNASISTCRTCRVPVVVGSEQTTPGVSMREVTCDVDSLSVAGELQALIDGRGTYDLKPATRGQPGQWRLVQRRRWCAGHVDSFRSNPIGGADQRWAVLADHACGAPLDAHPFAPPSTAGPPVDRDGPAPF